jgi:hypothetical protein
MIVAHPIVFRDAGVRSRHRFILKMALVTIVLYALLVLIVIIIWIVIEARFQPFVMPAVSYQPSTSPVTRSRPAAMCDLVYDDFSLVQLAGLSLIAGTSDTQTVNETLKYLFNGTVPEHSAYTDNALSSLFLVKFQNRSVGAFPPVAKKTDVGLLVENLFNQYYPNLLYNIIPFFQIANSLFLDRFLSGVTEHIASALGIRQLSVEFVDFVNKTEVWVLGRNAGLTLWTGHSIGGFLAKGAGTAFHGPTVSFEALEYHGSVYGNTMSLKLAGQTSPKAWDDNSWEIVSVWSPQSFLSRLEPNMSVNAQLPNLKNYLHILTPADTFCMVAAGCATDSTFDNLCNLTVGNSTYTRMFSAWNRDRSYGISADAI